MRAAGARLVAGCLLGRGRLRRGAVVGWIERAWALQLARRSGAGAASIGAGKQHPVGRSAAPHGRDSSGRGARRPGSALCCWQGRTGRPSEQGMRSGRGSSLATLCAACGQAVTPADGSGHPCCTLCLEPLCWQPCAARPAPPAAEEELQDWSLYAENVRQLMGRRLGVPLVQEVRAPPCAGAPDSRTAPSFRLLPGRSVAVTVRIFWPGLMFCTAGNEGCCCGCPALLHSSLTQSGGPFANPLCRGWQRSGSCGARACGST